MATPEALEAVPKAVVCGPYTYAVTFDEQAAYDYQYAGCCLFGSKRLDVNPKQADTALPQTLLHEILHALGNAYEIEAWSKHTLNDKQEVTDKIDLMATALLQFLRSNPEVVSWLQGTV